MEKKELKGHIASLEDILEKFVQAKTRGKETNSNEERGEAIANLEEATQKLELYVQNNVRLLKLLAGTDIELAREVKWNDIVRPKHFEDDLREEIRKLKEKVSE